MLNICGGGIAIGTTFSRKDSSQELLQDDAMTIVYHLRLLDCIFKYRLTR